MNSKDYWQEREREALDNYITEEAEYSKELNRIYEDMLDSVQREIESFYQKYAAQEGITLAEAMKRVSQLDIEAYEAKAKRYVESKDFSDAANSEMRLYNLTMKINRLEMLKSRIGLALVDGYDEAEKKLRKELYKRVLDEYERQAGILGESVSNPEERARELVNASFKWGKGKYGFSEALWTHQAALKAELAKLLQQGLIQGRSSTALAAELRKAFNVSKYAAERLMRTEMRRVQTEAQMQSFKQNEYDQYVFITLSSAPYTKSRVCDICRPLNGEVFDVKGAKVGDPDHPLPPMHPNCRCSIAAHMDEAEFEKWLDSRSNGNSSQSGVGYFLDTRKGAIISDQEFESMQNRVDKYLDKYPDKIKNELSKYSLELGGDTYGLDAENKVLFLGKDFDEYIFDHEMGHLLETSFLDGAKLDELKEKLLDGMSRNDLLVGFGRNAAGASETYLYIEDSRLYTKYQGRFYPDENGDVIFDAKHALEIVSETLPHYMNGEGAPNEFISELFDLIKEALR